MKITKLYIKKFRILEDFLIQFPEDTITDISVLIGENGAGKTTVFEAITEIFSCLILGKKAKFDFEIEYLIPKSEVILDSSTWGESRTTYFGVKIIGNYGNDLLMSVILPNGSTLNSINEINNDRALSRLHSHLPSNLYKLIPDNIVVYYSGSSEILHDIIKGHEDIFKENLKNGVNNIPQVLFYYNSNIFKIVLLSLLSYEYGDIPEFLKTKANISSLVKFRLYFQRPEGSKAKLSEQWNTKGKTRRLFDFLDEKKDEWTTNKTGTRLLETNFNVTINSHEYLLQLRDFFREERELFDVLYTSYLDGYLTDIEFLFRNDDVMFDNLSEGEQQAITVRGLMELLSEENSLFLFDEPDTYLHPKWQQDFLGNIYKFVDENTNLNSSFLISTHSPQLIANAEPHKVHLLSIHNGKVGNHFQYFFGKDINSILYDIMSSDYRNISVKEKLNLLFKYIALEEIDNAEEFYLELVKILGEDDPNLLAAQTEIDFLKQS